MIAAPQKKRTAGPGFGFIAIMLAVLLFCGVFSRGAVSAANAEPANAVGVYIGDFSTVDVYGQPINGSAFNSHELTIIHYFATWSPDCIREMGYMQEAADSFGGDLLVIGLLHEDATSTAFACRELIESYGFTYRCVLADRVLSTLTTLYPMIPQTFFVSPNGVVVDHFPGCFEGYSQLSGIVEGLIGHMPEYHSVRFYDGLTGHVIARVSVLHGTDATPPAAPHHPGYVFSGWDGDYHNVTEDRDILGVYVTIPENGIPGDVDNNGFVTVSDALAAMRHAMGIIYSGGAEQRGDMDGDGHITITDAVMILRIAIGIS